MSAGATKRKSERENSKREEPPAPAENPALIPAAGTPAPGPAPRSSSRSFEIEALRLAWAAARPSPAALPPCEKFSLSGVGRLALDAALIRPLEPQGFLILTAGERIEAAIGAPSRSVRIGEGSSGLVKAIDDAARRALAKGRPVEATAHSVEGGYVCGYDLVALPLANNWGPPLCQLYVQGGACREALADALLGGADTGIAALAVLRDGARGLCDFEFVALNEAAARLLQQPAAALTGRRLSDLAGEPEWAQARDVLLRLCASGESQRFELAAGGAPIAVAATSIGDLVALTLRDCGEQVSRGASFRLLFEGSPTPTALCDPQTLAFLAVNEAAATLWGYAAAELLAMSAFDVTPEEEWEALWAQARREPDKMARRIGRHIRSDRNLIDVVVHSRSIVFDGGPAHLVTVADVTEKQLADARLAHMAHHDGLTDLPNRAHFRGRLDEALARLPADSGELAVLHLDLDEFKAVNDTLGHDVGDALLRAAAERLRALAPAQALARFGDDEFALMKAVAGADEAAKFAAEVADSLSRSYLIEGHCVVIGASVGIAMAPGDGRACDLLLKNADMALDRAKQEGRRGVRFFEPEMDARAQARRQLEVDLRRALSAGEFELYYQPLVALKTGAITGFEALMRWRHPRRGMVPPADFIGLAEEIGLIVPLGEWALRQACAEAAKWPRRLKVAVNLSSVQFKSGNLIHAVLTALASSGLSASQLELEITESILLVESEANLATLHSLRSLGVSVSMDDFGTGCSSLSYLRAFPFDKIKIDRSFVSEIGGGGRGGSMAIVRAVAGLGVSLGVPTTAEGVETSEQLAWLREEGCTEMQGYFFSPPVPASKILPMLKANETADPRFAPQLKH